ncbi:hypothetical protein CEE45_12540 [Candidatus Heimdallarchaeota archaeon B3_Heim]|nr:MAG: hypothetical protein CEE45_12540 [Candidatus Heimdallarchaeota archaeon B3_Heim]
MEFKRDSTLVRLLFNYLIAEILFFIGSGILVIYKMSFELDMEDLLTGTFLGSSSLGLFTEGLGSTQIDWLTTNLFLWPVNVFFALFSSLLLLAGFFALAILIPLQVDVFTGGNAIDARAVPVGIMFLICWGLFPCLYMIRSTFLDWGSKIKGVFVRSPS